MFNSARMRRRKDQNEDVDPLDDWSCSDGNRFFLFGFKLD